MGCTWKDFSGLKYKLKMIVQFRLQGKVGAKMVSTHNSPTRKKATGINTLFKWYLENDLSDNWQLYARTGLKKDAKFKYFTRRSRVHYEEQSCIMRLFPGKYEQEVSNAFNSQT